MAVNTDTNRWLQFLPGFVRRKINSSPHLLKAIANSGWLFADRVLRLLVGLFVGVWLARYLGPEQYGLYSYVVAFISLFTAISTMGLNGIVVRELVKQPEEEKNILGSAFVLQVAGAILALILSVLIIYRIRESDELAQYMLIVMGFTMLFKSSDIVKYWFESKVESRYSVIVENSVFILFAVIKVVLIISQASIVEFAWVFLAESIVSAIGLFFIYFRTSGNALKWRYLNHRAVELLKHSWPLVLSGLAVMLYMRIDQIMIGQMLGNSAVGVYSVAVRLSEVWYMIPTVVMASLFPKIVELKETDKVRYENGMQNILYLLAAVAIFLSVAMSFSSGFIMMSLFGNEYADSASVLFVHVWASIFVFVGVAGGKWYLAENIQVYSLVWTSLGAIINVILNLVMIPKFGIVGAAVSTVISYAASAYLFDALTRKTRGLFVLKTRALLFGFIWERKSV